MWGAKIYLVQVEQVVVVHNRCFAVVVGVVGFEVIRFVQQRVGIVVGELKLLACCYSFQALTHLEVVAVAVVAVLLGERRIVVAVVVAESVVVLVVGIAVEVVVEQIVVAVVVVGWVLDRLEHSHHLVRLDRPVVGFGERVGEEGTEVEVLGLVNSRMAKIVEEL